MYRVLRFTLLAWFAVLGLGTAAAQNESPVRWHTAVEAINDSLYRITLQADIARDWHMYDLGPYEGGPNATEIRFTAGDGARLAGELKEVNPPERHMDRVFGMEIGYYEGRARFTQEAVATTPGAEVTATVGWMVCNTRTNACNAPEEQEFVLRLGSASAASAASTAPAAPAASAIDEPRPAAPGSDSDAGAPHWGLIIEAMLWGLAALLTPCVFPMVPMTVSYFLKSSSTAAAGRLRALLYGLFIVALYTLPIAAVILITRTVGGDAVTADIFNWIATHWLPNLLFFAVFMIFAASFFGAFEITLPSGVVNRADARADTRGVAGIFFLALTLVLVSFSCTGPIVGSVLIKSTAGEFWSPILTILAFSVVFALPFTLLALFPSLLGKLPRSGGWLNSVKVVLGFVEVALGLKFLSVADQTYHWGILDREVYLAIWITVFTLMGFYLLGKLKFAHDSDLKHIGVGRLALAIATFSFVVYLIPGMWGAPLKALSGYLPPLTSQDFVLGRGSDTPQAAALTLGGAPKYADVLRLPHGLEGFFDLAEAEAYAAQVGKPLFIDFTGHGCVNCREMEERVWSDPRVLAMLRNDYVLVALYSDDKMQLPESDWVTTPTGKVLRSLGKINSYYARTRYGVNAQPCYILQGRDGALLAPPRGYDLSVEGFLDFLQAGLKAYRQAD